MAVAVVDGRQGPYAPVHRTHVALLACLFRNLVHIRAHAFVGLIVVRDNLLRLFARDADALRQPERLDRVGDGEVDDLGEAALLFQLLFRPRAEDELRRARVYVLAMLEGFEHDGVARDVREQAQF